MVYDDAPVGRDLEHDTYLRHEGVQMSAREAQID